MCFLIAPLTLISIRTGELRRQVFFKKSYQYYEVFSNNSIYMSSFVDVCARTEDPWARVGVPAAHRARSSNNRHQDPESSLNLKKWEYGYTELRFVATVTTDSRVKFVPAV